MTQALERARRLLARAPLIDGHNDLAWTIREHGGDAASYDLRVRTPGRTDLPRLAEGGVGGQFWAAYVPCTETGDDVPERFLSVLALARQVFAAYPDRFEEAFTADDVERANAAGRIACLLGVEGGQAIGGSLERLRALRALGVRYLTLTHNCTTDWADAATDAPRHGGLSPFGVRVVEEMNRLGMLVDVSHTSPEAMHKALDVSAAPLIWSHASARSVVDHPRNAPDDALARLRDNGGIAMVTFVPRFVAAGRPARLTDVADHLDRMRAVAGADHVGVGSDFDGFAGEVEGLEDVARFPALFAELIERGWSDEDLEKLARGNILRVMRAVERIAGL
jgi:membrane dipeptidase